MFRFKQKEKSLEECLGKRVTIEFHDGTTSTGILKHNSSLNMISPSSRYSLKDGQKETMFQETHVRRIIA